MSLNDDNVQTTASDKVIVPETPRNKKLSELDEVMPFAATDVPEPSAKPTESDSATKADKDDKMVDKIIEFTNGKCEINFLYEEVVEKKHR